MVVQNIAMIALVKIKRRDGLFSAVAVAVADHALVRRSDSLKTWLGVYQVYQEWVGKRPDRETWHKTVQLYSYMTHKQKSRQAKHQLQLPRAAAAPAPSRTGSRLERYVL